MWVRGGSKHYAFMMSELHGTECLALRTDELNLIIKTGYSLMTGIWFPASLSQPVSCPIGRPQLGAPISRVNCLFLFVESTSWEIIGLEYYPKCFTLYPTKKGLK